MIRGVLRAPLPIDPFLPEIASTLESRGSLVLLAEPGAGKTTRVPLALEGGEWILLQPRRVAARLCAERLARESGAEVGREIGYQIRFENRTSKVTRIRVVTEGILLKMLERDLELKGVKGVLFDEFHERNLFSDLGLAFARELQESLRPDLKILVMSATMDPKPVSRFLNDAPVLEVPGRVFPVEVSYRPVECAQAIQDVLRGKSGAVLKPGRSILAFLPGWREIKDTERRLRSVLPDTMELHILHSRVPLAEQKKAVEPSARGKVILSTNIAETSVTIDSVGVVIDAGLARVARVDPQFGFERLELSRISQASAIQRAGRAGRTEAGFCVRLYPEGEFRQMRPYETPEIQRADLSSVLAQLASLGALDFEKFAWFEAPPKSQVARARETLSALKAIEPSGALTALGKRALEWPVPIRFGVWMEAAKRFRCEAWSARKIAELTAEPRLEGELLRRTGVTAADAPASRESMLGALLEAFPDRVFSVERGGMAGGRQVRLRPGLHAEGAFGVALDLRELSERGKTLVRVEDALFFELAEARLVLGDSAFQTRREVRWDFEARRVAAREGLALGDLLIEKGRDAHPTPEEAEPLLLRQASQERDWLLDRQPEAKLWIDRLTLARAHGFESEFPDPAWDSAWMREILEQWCAGKRSFDALLKEDLGARMKAAMDYAAVKRLGTLCPERIEVPSGRAYKIDYSAERPSLEVRLQEVFGWERAPLLLEGRVPLRMVLLAPNYRPAQITDDLSSFWTQTYPEVRKELRARYPKHAWPEDPRSFRAPSK